MNQQNIRIVTMAGICMLALAGCGSTYAAGKADNPPAATIEEAASASVTIPQALVSETTTPASQTTVQESVPAPVAEDSVAQTPARTEIGVEKAKEIALNHAGLSASEVGFIKAHMDYDDGRQVYDVEFYKDMTEYDYEIDAFTGDIWSYDFDIEGYAIPQQAPAAPAQTQAPAAPAQQQTPAAPAAPAPQAPAQQAAPAQSAGQISLEQAKQIATNHAGVSGVTFIKAHQDYDDGRLTYEVDFVAGTTEYDYEIDAATGAILEFDAESIYDD